MATSFITPDDFKDFKDFDYKREFKLELSHLGSDRNELHPFLLIEDYYFENNKALNVLLFIDLKSSGDWQELVPAFRVIAAGKGVIKREQIFDDEPIEEKRAKDYIFDSVYGKCKVAKVADFNGDGKADYAIEIITALGRGASMAKAKKILEESKKTLFKGEHLHILPQTRNGEKYTFEDILKDSREMKIAKKEGRKNEGEEQEDSEDEIADVGDKEAATEDTDPA